MGNIGNSYFLVPVRLTTIPSNIVQISAGWTHTVVLNNIGEAYSFGSNNVMKKHSLLEW
jgi:alpha-tubulin suppressor-like RCC1 family protein